MKLLCIQGVALQLSDIIHIGILNFLQQTAEVLVSKDNLIECLGNCCELLCLALSSLEARR